MKVLATIEINNAPSFFERYTVSEGVKTAACGITAHSMIRREHIQLKKRSITGSWWR